MSTYRPRPSLDALLDAYKLLDEVGSCWFFPGPDGPAPRLELRVHPSPPRPLPLAFAVSHDLRGSHALPLTGRDGERVALHLVAWDGVDVCLAEAKVPAKAWAPRLAATDVESFQWLASGAWTATITTYDASGRIKTPGFWLTSLELDAEAVLGEGGERLLERLAGVAHVTTVGFTSPTNERNLAAKGEFLAGVLEAREDERIVRAWVARVAADAGAAKKPRLDNDD